MHQRQDQTDSGTAAGQQICKSAAKKQQVQPKVDVAHMLTQHAAHTPSIHILLCCNMPHLSITRIIIYKEKSSLVTHPLTPPKSQLVLCDSDDGFFLGDSQNVARDYYCSTSIYLVLIWHLLTFAITPTPSCIKNLLGGWRHSTEFKSRFKSKSLSTSLMVLIHSINLFFCTWGKD